MYLDYWGLQTPPFANVPTQNLFYPSPQHDEALSRLLYAVKHRRGVAMLTGQVGCGKTTVAKTLMNCLNQDRFQFQLISNPALGPLDLIKAVLLSIGEKAENGTKPVLLAKLHARLSQSASSGISTVLAIDEAHVIKNEATLDELRMFLNFQEEEQFLLTLILLGQPPLLKRIAELQPLKERISVKFNLEPLDENNTLHYIRHRLKSVGAARELFSREASQLLYDYSCGIPLRINNLCDRCLLIGFMRESKVIDTGIVADAIQDLN